MTGKPLNTWTPNELIDRPFEAVRAIWAAHDEIERLNAAVENLTGHIRSREDEIGRLQAVLITSANAIENSLDDPQWLAKEAAYLRKCASP